jgi:HEAT repeat protein
MKKVAIGIVLLAGALAVAGVDLSNQQQDTLTAIDTVPTRPVLDVAFAGSAQAGLLAVVADGSANPGVRLRAIAALASYDPQPGGSGDAVHPALLQIISANTSARTGTNVLVLRAAIETLGRLQVPSDVTVLEGLLEHPSRDIEAAAALALGNLCNTTAINALRTRYAEPGTTDQVKLAISEALRILGGSPAACSVN